MLLDANQLKLEIFTYKEGLLSKVAHDLRIVAEKTTVTVDGERLEVRVDLNALSVASAQKNGTDDHGALSAGDKKKIRGTLQKDVLHTNRYPEAHFEGTFTLQDDGASVEGRLSLHGTTRNLTLPIKKQNGTWQGSVRLHQPDFGITPYSAMLGTLKVQAGVDIRFSAPVAT